MDIDPDKTSTVHLGFKPLPNASVTPAAPVDVPYLLYVGVRSGYKNFKNLLRAYASSSPLNRSLGLVCFGGGPFSRQELQYMDHLKIDKTRIVQVEGDDAMLAACYRNARAFVYPSLYEGFGIPPLEAMSASCPVICSSTGSVPEIVGDAGEYFDPEQVEDIRRAIETVAFDDERSDILRQLGKRQLTRYSWEKCAHESLQIYQSVL